MSLPDDVTALVKKWLNYDHNPATRSEILALVEAGAVEDLRAALSKRIAFGTAGTCNPLSRAVVSTVLAGTLSQGAICQWVVYCAGGW
jgi:hypothetical protein